MIANIKPGILVAMRTKIVGGVEYQKKDLEPPIDSPDADVKRWETTRVIDDPEEYDRARAARSAAQAVVNRVCVRSDFGLLCPETKENDLNAAIAAARQLASTHNASSTHTQVEVYVLKGRVADSDEEAVKGIAAEVRALLDGMSAGIDAADPEAIRKAATRARRMGAMLDAASAGKVAAAVTEARDAAKQIVRRVIDGSEAAETVVAEVDRTLIDAARFMFLDLDPVAEPSEPMPEESREVGAILTEEAV